MGLACSADGDGLWPRFSALHVIDCGALRLRDESLVFLVVSPCCFVYYAGRVLFEGTGVEDPITPGDKDEKKGA